MPMRRVPGGRSQHRSAVRVSRKPGHLDRGLNETCGPRRHINPAAVGSTAAYLIMPALRGRNNDSSGMQMMIISPISSAIKYGT